MGLTAGIVGLPNVGKSTLFNALTRGNVLCAKYAFSTVESNVGNVELRDARLDRIAEVVKPRKVVYTSFSFTDIAGLVEGASFGEGLGNQFLSQIRELDAICHVVRCFDDPDVLHVSGAIDPMSDIEVINLELIFADLEVIDKRLPKIVKKAALKVDPELEREYQILKQIKETLELGKAAREAGLTKDQIHTIKNFNFLTLKPVIYVLNVSEENIQKESEQIQAVRAYAKETNSTCVAISAKIEQEIADLSEEDREMFMEELGIKQSGLFHLAQETYDLLGLATFFTAGEKEARAWTFKKGMKAPECAGVIHSDLERGFIRAEVIAYDDFTTYGTIQKAKETGKMRSEGKEYIFKDGDIALFRFNV